MEDEEDHDPEKPRKRKRGMSRIESQEETVEDLLRKLEQKGKKV